MPRVPYVKESDLTPQSRPIYERIRATRGATPRLFAALLHSPTAADRIAALGEYVRFQAPLDDVVRETIVLTVASEMKSSFEWEHHEPIARKVGVRDQVVQAIREGHTRGLLPKEAVFIDYAKEVLRNQVKDSTFTAIEHLLGTRGAVDLTVAVSYYAMLAHITLALQITTEKH